MRVYPINEDALENLGTLNRDFSLLFAASAGFGGFALDLTKDLFLTAPEDAERLAYAAGVNAVCWIVSVGLALAAGSKWVEKGARMKKLKENVTFAE